MRLSAAATAVADGLALAASPTFAVMALLTAVLDGGPAAALCAAGQASPLGGMVAMYALMAAFNAAAWLKRIPGARRPATAAGGSRVAAARRPG